MIEGKIEGKLIDGMCLLSHGHGTYWYVASTHVTTPAAYFNIFSGWIV